MLQKATTAKQTNEEATALEKIQVEVSGSYGLDGKIDIGQLNTNLKRISGLKYKGNTLSDLNKIDVLPATVELDGYKYEIEDNGAVSKKTGITLNKYELAIEINETATLTAELNNLTGEITWESDTPTVATVDGGEVTGVANGTAKIVAKCGTKKAECVVNVVPKLSNAEIGAYVDINVGYTDQKNSTVYTNTGWRVYKRYASGRVDLISAGHPLTFYSPNSGGEASINSMNEIGNGSITLQTSSTERGYQSSGFTPSNIAGLFSNSTVFGGVGMPIDNDIRNHILRETGYPYWLGKRDGAILFVVNSSGGINTQGAAATFAIRPVVTINSGVKIKGGNGTSESPYRLNGINY